MLVSASGAALQWDNVFILSRVYFSCLNFVHCSSRLSCLIEFMKTTTIFAAHVSFIHRLKVVRSV